MSLSLLLPKQNVAWSEFTCKFVYIVWGKQGKTLIGLGSIQMYSSVFLFFVKLYEFDPIHLLNKQACLNLIIVEFVFLTLQYSRFSCKHIILCYNFIFDVDIVFIYN